MDNPSQGITVRKGEDRFHPGKVIDQSFGLNTGITSLGKRVIYRLLNSTNGSNKKERNKIDKFFYTREKKLRLRARLVWNHIQHIAELLDSNGLDAWGTTAIGTYFDGIVDPPFGYWTSEHLLVMYAHLLEYTRAGFPPDLSGAKPIVVRIVSIFL